MYGARDTYNSPVAEFGGDDDLAEIDAYLAEDDEDEDDEDQYGILGINTGRGSILGIAISKGAKEKKLANILGRLKGLYEKGKKETAARYARSLARVNLVDPDKKAYDEDLVTPEVQAWIDYGKTEDWEALTEALEAVSWTGEELPDSEEEGEVYSPDGSVKGRHRRGRKLPPGFRPRGYKRWGPARKMRWLNRHPVAHSQSLPIDPDYRGPVAGGRPGHTGMRAAYRAGRASSAPPPPPARTRHPFMRAAYRAGQATSAPAPRPVAPFYRPPTSASRPPATMPGAGHPAQRAAYVAGRSGLGRPGLPAVRSSFRAGRYGEDEDEDMGGVATRGSYRAGRTGRGQPGLPGVRGSFRAGRGYGLDEAIEEGVEEFGATLIGTDAFRNLQGHEGLSHSMLQDDDLDDELEGDDLDDLDDEDDDESMGAYISSYGEDDEDEDMGAYVPQFGAVFKRDIEDKLEAARRKYERLVRTEDVHDTTKGGGADKVAAAWKEYERLKRAIMAASAQPAASRKGPALREQIEAEREGRGDEDAPVGLDAVTLFRSRLSEDDEDDEDMESDLEDMGISMGQKRGAA